MLTPERLARYGRMLFGDPWQSALAAALGVNERTMRRWVSGSVEIPEGIEVELKVLSVKRIAEIEELLLRRFP